jgi:hypothetical protein
MAMIPCEQCGKEISDIASTCPHCGAQTRFSVEYRALIFNNIARILLIVGIFLAGWSAFQWSLDMTYYNDGDWRTDGYNYETPLSEHEKDVATRFGVGLALCLISVATTSGTSVALKTRNTAVSSDAENTNTPLFNGDWKCTCGKVNAHNIGTCECGLSKKQPDNISYQFPKNPPHSPDEITEALKTYKSLLDSGVISQEDFDQKKKELLGL